MPREGEWVHTKGNLRHYHQDGHPVFITFRLADSLPQQFLEQHQQHWQQFQLDNPQLPPDELRRQFAQQYHIDANKLLDQGYGECLLAQQQYRNIVSQALGYHHDTLYLLHQYVIMPNHVHLILEPLGTHDWQTAIHSVKTFTARAINKARQHNAKVWQRESFDRLIRDQDHYNRVWQYIADNPRHLPSGTFEYWHNTPDDLYQSRRRWAAEHQSIPD